MKKLLLSVVIIFASYCFAHAQVPVVYEAKVYTPSGVKTGVLERVYNHGVGIVIDDDVAYIDALEIKEIKVKRYSASFGSKVLGTALLGSMAALDMASKADDDKLNNPANYDYNYKPSTISDNAGYALLGATLGSLVGAIPPIRKNKKFTINQDSSLYNKALEDIAQYGRYNQLVPLSVNAN